MIFGLEREANDPAAPLALTERGYDILSFHEVQIDRLARLGDFVRFDPHWPVVARRGGTDVFRGAKR